MRFIKLLAVAVIMLTVPFAMASDYRPSGGSGGGGAGPAGPSTLVFVGSSQIPLSGSTLVYIGATASTAAAEAGIPITNSTTFTKVAVDLSVGPGTGKTWTITVMKDNTPTSASSTITGNSTSVALTTNIPNFAYGEKFSLKVDPTQGTPSSTIITFTAQAVLN